MVGRTSAVFAVSPSGQHAANTPDRQQICAGKSAACPTRLDAGLVIGATVRGGAVVADPRKDISPARLR